MKKLFCIFALLFSAALPQLTHPAQAQPVKATRAEAEKDHIFKAMLEELDRSKAELQLKGFQKPFFIEYHVEDITGFRTNAEYGATLNVTHLHRRGVRVIVHVGDYKLNSAGEGDSSGEIEVLDDDPIALRTSLWVATDEAYKAALDAFTKRQAELKQVETPPQADDFSKEQPTIQLEPPQLFSVDEDAWIKAIAHVTGLYRTGKGLKTPPEDVEYSRAYFSSYKITSWLVNSEGTIVRTNEVRYEQSFSTGGQAADGMKLDRSYYIAGTKLSDLDTPEEFDRHAIECINGLGDLLKAPLVEEEYHGPVLIEADAAAGVMKALLASPIAASRPQLGTAARTTGAFASSYHDRVLPEFMNVVDDPRLAEWNGKGLTGSYAIDDEGVPAQAVEVVKNGKLENYLLARTPILDFPNSNGHGRAGLFSEAHPSIAVLKITAQNGSTEDELNQKLLAMAKDRALDNVYVVEAMQGGMRPRLLYRVGKDGKRTLVRGAKLEDLDLRALRSGIVAAGNELFANNSVGNIPDTVLAPSLLFDDVTIKRANEKNDKLPYYPPPAE